MILFCFGTRPEWLKIKPLIDIMSPGTYQTLFTGQHEDLLESVNVDYRIAPSQSRNRLDQLVSDCVTQFPDSNCTSVLVQGDTASAFACALAAFHRRMKIYYLEAGLRSYNLDHPYPEEGYRQMISRISDVNFCPTTLSKQNLQHDRAHGECHVVGNTVLDNLVQYKDSCSYGSKVLVTMHRRENHTIMQEWFTEINSIAESNPDIEFILPIHPNPAVSKHKHILTHVKVVDPLPYDELLDILTVSKFVISDSGGLQEEGAFFNKKVIVCRQTTERPEGIDTGHLHLCDSPSKLVDIFNRINHDYKVSAHCPYGDGRSSTKIKNILMQSTK